jgi:hypothetical protein
MALGKHRFGPALEGFAVEKRDWFFGYRRDAGRKHQTENAFTHSKVAS